MVEECQTIKTILSLDTDAKPFPVLSFFLANQVLALIGPTNLLPAKGMEHFEPRIVQYIGEFKTTLKR